VVAHPNTMFIEMQSCCESSCSSSYDYYRATWHLKCAICFLYFITNKIVYKMN